MTSKFILLVSVIVSLAFTSDNEAKDYLNVKTITLNEQVYDLRWSSKNDNYYIQEYLTAEDSLPDFNEMVSLFVLNEKVSMEDAIAIKVNELKMLRKQIRFVTLR